MIRRNIFNRTPDDSCLLCKINKASKTESHIISKFLGKSLKISNNNKFNLISSELKNKPIQDLPKVDYLFCPDCEKKFEIIETEVSRILSQINNDAFSGDFTIKNINDESDIIKHNHLEPVFLYLFVYIQTWRIAAFVNKIMINIKMEGINDYRLFEYFRLGEETEEKLRITINENLFISKTEFLNNIDKIKQNLTIFPFVLFTHQGIIQKESGFFYANTPDYFTTLLYMNNFKLVVFFNNSFPNAFSKYINKNIDDAGISILNDGLWNILSDEFIKDPLIWNRKK